MSSHRRRLDVARRAAAAELSNIGAELRTAREQAGLSQAAVAATLGWRREKISRIENARLRTAALHDLMANSAALGLTMRTKVYPDGPPLRDIAQLSVSQRLLRRISNTWRVRMEVPLMLPGDRRAFDLWLSADGISIAVEVFTKVRDVQAQIRGAHLKWRDSNAARLIVVVAESHANRAVLRSVEDLIGLDYPISARVALSALEDGRDSGGNAIVIV
jgi:transcriptional regulator with XRE-family HTH domain